MLKRSTSRCPCGATFAGEAEYLERGDELERRRARTAAQHLANMRAEAELLEHLEAEHPIGARA